MLFKKYWFLCALFAVIIQSCKKDDDKAQIVFPSTTTSVTVGGRVLNEGNLPLPYAMVTAGGVSSISDSLGYYALYNAIVPVTRGVIEINRSGYAINYIGFTPKNGVQYINVVLQALSIGSFMNTSGGTINLNTGGTMVFPPNAVVTEDGQLYTGSVQVKYDIADTDDSLYRYKLPGYDRLALNSQNKQMQFRSLSFAYVKLMSGTTALKLDSGVTVTFKLPIPASQIASAPAITSLCSFNETTAVWREDGVAIRNGNFYDVTVSHFSFWGCGSLHTPAYLKGRVLDCNNNPLPNINVTFDYDNYEFTDNNGYFYKRVPSNTSFDVIAAGYGVFSSPIPVSGIAAGQLYDVGNIVLQCPAYLSGYLQNCSGSGTPGWIQASYGSQYGGTAMYSTTGVFNLPVAPNIPIMLSYITANKLNYGSVISPAQGATTSLGVIPMCYVADTANMVTVNGGGFTNEVFYIDAVQTYGQNAFAQYRNQALKTYFKIYGTTLQGRNIQFTGYINGSGNGSYACDPALTNQLKIFMYYPVTSEINSYSTEFAGSQVSLNVISYGDELNYFKAYFNGTIVSNPAGGNTPVTVTGKMRMQRAPNYNNMGNNKITANNDGFVNQQINFDWCSSLNYSLGYVASNYQSASNATTMKLYGCANSAGYHGTLSFKGNSPGTYTAPNDFYTTGFSIRPQVNMATTKTYNEIVSGTLTVNSYAPAGGFITGTFSGVFKRTDPVSGTPYTVSVTNATFNTWHYPDN